MYQQPEQSPWGKVQIRDILCLGVLLASTASHGGTMVAKNMVAVFSPATIKCGFRRSGFLYFEEDTQEDVALWGLLGRKLQAVPDRIKNKTAFEENIDESLRECSLNYWRVRQAGLEKTPAWQTVPIHNAER